MNTSRHLLLVTQQLVSKLWWGKGGLRATVCLKARNQPGEVNQCSASHFRNSGAPLLQMQERSSIFPGCEGSCCSLLSSETSIFYSAGQRPYKETAMLRKPKKQQSHIAYWSIVTCPTAVSLCLLNIYPRYRNKCIFHSWPPLQALCYFQFQHRNQSSSIVQHPNNTFSCLLSNHVELP